MIHELFLSLCCEERLQSDKMLVKGSERPGKIREKDNRGIGSRKNWGNGQNNDSDCHSNSYTLRNSYSAHSSESHLFVQKQRHIYEKKKKKLTRRKFKNLENDHPSDGRFCTYKWWMDLIRFDSCVLFRYVPASKFLYLSDILKLFSCITIEEMNMFIISYLLRLFFCTQIFVTVVQSLKCCKQNERNSRKSFYFNRIFTLQNYYFVFKRFNFVVWRLRKLSKNKYAHKIVRENLSTLCQILRTKGNRRKTV